jgi:hypothetical protein
MFKKLDMNILINGAPIRHGDFHNIAFLLIFASAAALALKLAGMRFGDSFLFAGVGFGAHIFGKGWLSCHGYRYLWSGEAQKWGIGMNKHIPDL